MASHDVDVKKLLEAGAHFGHKTSRWHPKMAPYIHSKRGGNHIIDLTQTATCLESALQFLEEQTAAGKQVLIVGTKRQSKDIAQALAEKTGMPFVVNRWLGGMLTNQKTISGRVKYLKDLESRMETGELASKYNKLELQRYQEEIDDMNRLYGGIKNMAAKPNALFAFDVLHDANAVREAQRLNIPVVALVDTNTDPTGITYPIPCNDDAIKALQVVADYVEAALTTGKGKQKQTPDKGEAEGDK